MVQIRYGLGAAPYGTVRYGTGTLPYRNCTAEAEVRNLKCNVRNPYRTVRYRTIQIPSVRRFKKIRELIANWSRNPCSRTGDSNICDWLPQRIEFANSSRSSRTAREIYLPRTYFTYFIIIWRFCSYFITIYGYFVLCGCQINARAHLHNIVWIVST